jgi:dihydroorotate dehydrogenase electron transfer subunit
MSDSVAASPPARGVFTARVKANVPLCREHYRFVLEVEGFPPAAPGQFLQIQCREVDENGWTGGPFVRRPFSIGGLRRDGRRGVQAEMPAPQGERVELDIYHRAIGRGTGWLARLREGDEVSIIGPLGRCFSIPAGRRIAYLVGGGIGLPPLIWQADVLCQAGVEAVAFCGARTRELIPLTRVEGVEVSGDEGSPAFEEFARIRTPVVLSTDDGTLGAQGRIPDVFGRYLERRKPSAEEVVVYTCGPDIMMRSTARIAEQRGLDCYVCLERMMACGMGTCQSCVVPVRDADADNGWRYRLCCTDGPVFPSREVIWTV